MNKWTTIKNFKNIVDDIYQVSCDGEVRCKTTKKVLHKKISNKKKHPYYSVSLKTKNGKQEWILVHQLVATYFVKIPKKYRNCNFDLVPDHLDNDGLNNHYTNLEWKTRGENTKSAHENGFINNSCENSPHSLITNKEAIEICVCLENNMCYDEIIRHMNFPNTKKYRSLIVRIKNRIAWTDISKEFDFSSTTKKYTKSQIETIENLDLIRRLIKEGKRNIDIIRIVWGDDCEKINSKNITVQNIRKNKIYTEIP